MGTVGGPPKGARSSEQICGPVNASSQHGGNREEALQGKDVKWLMAARLCLAEEPERQLPTRMERLVRDQGMEPRSGSHLTSMSFFSSASSSFSDRWARR